MPENGPLLRVGDAERDEVVHHLGEHYVAGRMTLQEYTERSERACGARTVQDLAQVTDDLPAPAPPAPPPAKTPLFRSRRLVAALVLALGLVTGTGVTAAALAAGEPAGHAADAGRFGSRAQDGMAGVIEQVDDDTLRVRALTRTTVTVRMTDDTEVLAAGRNTSKSLAKGTRVLVHGDQDKSGTVTADRIAVMPR